MTLKHAMTTFLALTSQGIENLLEEELKTLGADNVKQSVASVSFTADISLAYHIVLSTRFATRILMSIGDYQIESVEELYELIYQQNWMDKIQPFQTFSVDFVGTNSFITNSQFGAVKVKDAIADSYTHSAGGRPDVDRRNPDVVIQARIRANKLKLLQDFSGPSLHQRGYRMQAGEAPLKENLAAALVQRSGWLLDTSKPLVDPFCGSGTILVEAALMARNIAPGLIRLQRFGKNREDNFAFQRFPTFRQDTFQQIVKTLEEKVVNAGKLQLFGSDTDKRVLTTARENAKYAGVARDVNFSEANAISFKPALQGEPESGTILTNPPYGERLGQLSEMTMLYNRFSLHLKRNFQDWNLAFFTADESPVHQLRLAKKRSYKLRNGPIHCQLYVYELSERQCEVNEASGLALYYAESESFANRLRKNAKVIDKKAKQEGVDCYRVYDADIPEYNVAIDRYADEVVIFEYQPPKTVEESNSRKRLSDILVLTTDVLDVDPNLVRLKVRERKQGAKQYEKMQSSDSKFVVQEYNAQFYVNTQDYLDTGLFLDHRLTRKMIGDMAKGKKVLNLFAYTGTASVHAALGGASSITTVDMSRTYLDWAKDNFALNGLEGKYFFENSDCLTWIDFTHHKFDLVFVDPPTFSNSKRMQDTFDVQRDHVDLLRRLCNQVLADDGIVVFSNNHRRFKMQREELEALGIVVEDITSKTIPFDFQRNSKIHNCWLVSRAK